MVTLNQERSAKKRKRNKSLDTSLTNEQSLQDSVVEDENNIEAVSPKQKSAKKRKKNAPSDSFSEETPKSVKASSDEVPKSTVEKKKRKAADNNTSLIEENNTKKKGKGKKEQDDDSSPSKPAKGKKQKVSSTDENTVESEEVAETEKSSSVKKKKTKKEKKVASFGVVDSKLLKESGGDSNTNDTQKPERPSRINRAVDYLHLWKTSRKSWKFNKNFQSLLIKAAYNSVIITEDDFETLLLYLGECKGNAREKLRTDAMALIKEDEDHLAEPVDEDMEKRAKAILQMLG